MRTVSAKERKKRGCDYCADFKMKGRKCKHDKCPYKELNGFKTYEDYYKSKSGFWAGFLEGVTNESKAT